MLKFIRRVSFVHKLFFDPGFLNTNTAPHQHPQMANYGLMDQIAGLKWIQQNIQHFGGDPESVTMFGYRNGASCIHFLMQSPAAVAGIPPPPPMSKYSLFLTCLVIPAI